MATGAFSFQRRLPDRSVCDPDKWEAHAYYGLTNIFDCLKYETGIQSGAQAVRLNPSAALAYHAAGCGLEWIGEAAKALESLNVVFKLDPNYNGRAAVLGQITTCQQIEGNEERAIEAARQLYAIAPDYPRGLQRCVSAFGYFGHTELAAVALTRLSELQSDFGEAYVRETYPYSDQEILGVFLEGFRRAGTF